MAEVVAGEKLSGHNCHFTEATLATLKLHSALTNSRGVSGLVRQVMEYYLATTINWADPRYREVERVEIPKEFYRGHHDKLGLTE